MERGYVSQSFGTGTCVLGVHRTRLHRDRDQRQNARVDPPEAPTKSLACADWAMNVYHPERENPMLKFTYKQTIRARVVGKCGRHPRYNPEKDGRVGIKGGCSTCFSLYDLHQSRLKLDAAIHDFIRRSGPWSRLPQRRSPKKTSETPDPTIPSGHP